MQKRKNYISWETYFMAIAELNAMRSKDPNTQVGCVVVNDLNQILSSGYNGLPRGLDDDEYPWGNNSENWMETKYPYVVHAELNAIVSSRTNLNNTTIYTTLFPCNECTKAIIQAGIKKIVYACDKYATTENTMASKKMFGDVNIEYVKVEPVNIKLS
ncbi:dCMP deaminase family protein [Spiroplasma endosymbiont of Labia minor]|uniref:deoxycytidylate deaminase n=1 Tax=Spiroplasma endosymbiont of Labia minor TaxID=3066305 RepID=UPI0030CF8423